MTDALVDQLVAGQFLVEGLLGEGGMGKVYRAVQIGLERPVALKVLHGSMPDLDGGRRRFHREALAASRIRHPGAVAIYSFGEWRGQLYIAMEFLPGDSLGDVLRNEKTLPGARAARVMIQVCDVIQAAHDASVLHRDLKPDNIMLVPGTDGEDLVKVVDFGLAILTTNEDQRLTREGLAPGTPDYMSPEQCRGPDIDGRSDVYSLGVVLYHVLCGKVPFWGETPTDVIVQHLYHDPAPPSAMNRKVTIHPSLESLTLRALSKSPEARPQTAQEFGQELRHALALVEDEELPPEMQRKEQLVAAGRATRAAAAGLPLPEELPRRGAPPASTAPRQSVLVVEPEDVRFSESPTACLRAHGLSATCTKDLDNAAQLARKEGVTLVVVDLGADAAASFGRLERSVGELTGCCPVVVVGPDDVSMMSRAIEMGLFAYVPRATVNSKLMKTVKRAVRRRDRKGH